MFFLILFLFLFDGKRYKNVVIASACSGHGFKFGPIVGELIAKMALNEQLPLNLDYFSIFFFSPLLPFYIFIFLYSFYFSFFFFEVPKGLARFAGPIKKRSGV